MMKMFLTSNLILVCLFIVTCGYENSVLPVNLPKNPENSKDTGKSKLPKEMPKDLEIRFGANYGMSPAYKKITIKGSEVLVESKDSVPNKIGYISSRLTTKISTQVLSKLYQVFVENEFDTITNDERKEIHYDAASEGIFIGLNAQNSFEKSYGDNQPLSGNNLKRYLTVRDAIFDSTVIPKNKSESLFSDKNQQIFKYNAEELSHLFKDAKPTGLSPDDFPILESFLEEAITRYNQNTASETQKISNLSSYNRQLIPYLNAKGEREVWLNFFCSANGVNWRKIIVAVDDGGSCYFELKINLVTKEVHDFTVNGAI